MKNAQDSADDRLAKQKAYIKSLLESEKEKNLLLTLSNEIASIKDKKELLFIIRSKFKKHGLYTDLAISLINEDNQTTTGYLIDWKKRRHGHPGYAKESTEKHNLVDGVFNTILESHTPVTFDLQEIVRWQKVPSYIQFLFDRGIRDMIAVALRDQNKAIGILYLFSEQKKVFTLRQMTILLGMSQQLGIAIANIIANEALVEKERDKSFLLSVSKDITSCQTKADILRIVKNKLAGLVHCNVILLCLNNPDKITHSNYLHTIPEVIENHPDFMKMATLKYYIDDGFYNIIQNAEYPVVFDVDEMVSRPEKPFYFDFWHANNIKEMVGISIRVNNQSIGAVVLHSELKNSFRMSELKLAQGVCSHIGIALSNIIAYEKIQSQLEEINRYKLRLEEENYYLQEQIKTVYNYSEIVGSSLALQHVFNLVSKVAASESTVLILGETGTGKELIARAIHNASGRKSRLMVKVNCAALPSQLIESELFGHEKGSFTGASDRRIGKFELANNSTLFLDEIGELALDLQAKLLRAIQEKEIERIGGKEVIKINARIIVATNRDLQNEVAAERFRSDLFYRINVFPITIPPLRDRKEDIPALVSHFINSFSRKLGKNITNISQKSLNELVLYHWPGNVRELEHLIERSILLTSGSTIKEVSLPKSNKAEPLSTIQNGAFKSLQQNERDYILATLTKTNGRVRGAGGAAEILQLPPTTLHSKMKKLGIRKTIG